MNKFKILIVDDNNQNRQIIASILHEEMDFDITLAVDGHSALESVKENKPDLILLDIIMPEMDGYEVVRRLKADDYSLGIPILFITALSDVEGIIKAFEVGGVDYITKPFKKRELLARVKAQVERKKIYDELKLKNELLVNKELLLTKMVEDQTKKLELMTITLITSLENANLFNDSDTGEHIRRVSEYSRILSIHYNQDINYAKKIKLFASLHDVGKVGIADKLLKKPGLYTSAEFQQMKQHVVLGAKMLDSPVIPEMAKNIALYHHEKWDGTGYVHNLQGKNIPLEARIVALADVYDALGNKRIYKNVITESEIDRIIKEESGKHFDPDLVDIYFNQKKTFIEIKNKTWSLDLN